MRQQALERRARRMLSRHGDKMTAEERTAVERALQTPDLMEKWCAKINEELPDAPEEPKYIMYGANGEFIDKLWQWFKENWPTILKLLLSLLVAL